MGIAVLDCTLRDGGYVNDWNFGQKTVKRMISQLVESNIDIVECGFLSNKHVQNPDIPIFDSIATFSGYIPKDRKNTKFVCMINYGEYLDEDIPAFDGSLIDGIRVAFHKKDAKNAIQLCRRIKEKGYMVFIQPMVTIKYTDAELLALVSEVNTINPYAFYIVDSFGVMKRNDLLRMFYLVDNNLNRNIHVGYHSHNNLQLAFSNAQSLVEVNSKRVTIIDSSVFGMGRGAGNLNTELFVEYLNGYCDTNYKIYPLLQMIDETLSAIYYTNYWGYSLPHYLSSVNNCHPNYASYLSNKNTLTIKATSEILGDIPEGKRDGFDKNFIEEMYIAYQKHFIDDNEMLNKLAQKLQGKKVLIIAPGKSIDDHRTEIEESQRNENVVSISVNFVPASFNCEYTFVSNSKRFASLMENTSECLPGTFILTSNIEASTCDCIRVNYSSLLNRSEKVSDNAVLMLLKLLIRLNVQSVLLAGYDGYSPDLTQNYAEKDMIINTNTWDVANINADVANVLRDYSTQISIEFLTPTRYFE